MSSDSTGGIITSSDGISWTSRVGIDTYGIWGGAYGNSKFVVASTYGYIFTSSDGTSCNNVILDQQVVSMMLSTKTVLS